MEKEVVTIKPNNEEVMFKSIYHLLIKLLYLKPIMHQEWQNRRLRRKNPQLRRCKRKNQPQLQTLKFNKEQLELKAQEIK